MTLTYIHLSDIHFGQERGGYVHTVEDVKNRLIEDVAKEIASIGNKRADGIIVTGDIAYSGKDTGQPPY